MKFQPELEAKKVPYRRKSAARRCSVLEVHNTALFLRIVLCECTSDIALWLCRKGRKDRKKLKFVKGIGQIPSSLVAFDHALNPCPELFCPPQYEKD